MMAEAFKCEVEHRETDSTYYEGYCMSIHYEHSLRHIIILAQKQ
jgi:hypothetical protein